MSFARLILIDAAAESLVAKDATEQGSLLLNRGCPSKKDNEPEPEGQGIKWLKTNTRRRAVYILIAAKPQVFSA